MFPVSVWMKKLTWEAEPRCITVMEPVERKTAMVLFDLEVRVEQLFFVERWIQFSLKLKILKGAKQALLYVPLGVMLR